ncbi:pimeloyl-ACP methyl ester carboxylesterase [Filimonas zeae]|uniref:AB hydrolase-1 domain-containing protein n=1 Tax=Filimonas zeae TaxID=1737353 RepID=A0A917MY83_9BACT|nr:alpha/beta fold hydrolase [Filimonas zeae]MDR6339672.1 pimeloyl-ACP methyl ester carboxylesterase [Filimonas zeae]GGH69079.1 hypothetical protein GCM10011379_26030 [Filimonas zeae]
MKMPLLLLHGAIGAPVQLQTIADILEDKYAVYTPPFPGHGGVAMPDEPFSIPFFAKFIADYIVQYSLAPVTIAGYSMGGYVAMYLARHQPHLVKRVVTLGTKFYWDAAVAQKETALLQPDTLLAKVPAFAATLEKMHAPNDWKQVLARTADMLQAMGQHNPLQEEDYAEITVPVTVMRGDRDKMVTMEETLAVYQRLSNARLAIVPGTPHAIELAPEDLLAALISLA